MNTFLRRFSGGAIVVVAGSAIVIGQQPGSPDAPGPVQPVFRANVNAVQLDVRVVDKDGNFVPDLTAADFRITEDKRPQALMTFSLVNIPIVPDTAPTLAGKRVESDVASNRQTAEGRLYVIVMDDKVNVKMDDDGPNKFRLLYGPNYRALARQFIEQYMTDGDRAAFLTTSGRKDLALEFTSNRARLLSSVDRFEPNYGQEVARTSWNSGVGMTTALDGTETAMFSLTALTKWLGQIEGQRKAIILFSEDIGGDWDVIEGTADREMFGAVNFRHLVEETARASVAIHVVDPITLDNHFTYQGLHNGANALAEATGGLFLFGPQARDNANADVSRFFAPGFARIVEESSNYYLLGYNSTNIKHDGKFRQVQVEVTRPGMTVRTRAGYFGADGKPETPPKTRIPQGLSETLATLLRSSLPTSGLTMTVTAPVYQDSGANGSVAVVVEARGRDLAFASDAARYRGAMEIALAAFDPDGNLKVGEKGVVTMAMSPATRDAMVNDGVRLVSRMKLKAGRYQLRVVARDSGPVGKLRGSVLYDLDVPDFRKGDLAMSGIAIASAVASQMPTTGTDRTWRATLGAMPTARREFSVRDLLRDYVEIYDNDPKPHDIVVTTTLRAAAGETVFSTEKATSRTLVKPKTMTIPIQTALPVKDLAAGGYILTVAARSSAHPSSTVTRDVPVTIK